MAWLKNEMLRFCIVVITVVVLTSTTTTTTFNLFPAVTAQSCQSSPARIAAQLFPIKTSSRRATGGSGKRREKRVVDERCGLYMAESTLPGDSGWGVFAGAREAYEEDDHVGPNDVGHTIIDYLKQKTYHQNVPEWLLEHYHWEGIILHASLDAEQLYAFLPGLGMLANCHPGLVNIDPQGALHRDRVPRSHPSAGAFSHYQQTAFSATRDLEPGDELFVQYGDFWFLHRELQYFGGIVPLSDDYQAADKIVDQWEALDLDAPIAKSVWNDLVIGAVAPLMIPRVRKALPKSYEDAMEAASKRLGVAEWSLGEHAPRRDILWLEENGYCLDNIETRKTTISHLPKQFGAFARRKLLKGLTVVPVPLIHLSKKHLEIQTKDPYGKTIWKGYQLLLNYCFGHKDSSIVLFPYSLGVNLINHADGTNNLSANVALRWASTSNSTTRLLKVNSSELLKENQRSGLLLELYALRDIQEEEELFLDYGRDWQEAWDKHEFEWQEEKAEYLAHFHDYQSPWDFETAEEIYTLNDDPPENYPPSNIEVRVWVAPLDKLEKDETDPDWYVWQDMEMMYLDKTLGCEVDSAEFVDKEKDTYRVVCLTSDSEDDDTDSIEVKIKAVPWSAITFIEDAYTGHQHLRDAFRHEIGLSNELFPDAWKDLLEDDDSENAEGGTCGLYMAESAIPNSGLGMYAAKDIKADGRIFSGDVVIQVEDPHLNGKLGLWYSGDLESAPSEWLLEHYFWNPQVSMAHFEAQSVQSIIPGLGMLANSHTGLVNLDVKHPTVRHDLDRSIDPGAGASTNYHDLHYVATKDIIAGEELFVRYGDHWFEYRTDLGMIPLKNDFVRADSLIAGFLNLLRGNSSSEVAGDLWKVLNNLLVNFNERVAAALPTEVKDIRKALQNGTASYSTPNRVRSLDWLKKNGRCLDNIKPGKSTLDQAGLGAFTTRSIKKGEIILPMPVVHIHKHDMDVFMSDNYDDPELPVRFLGKQQLINYCYGHKDSTLLLFPYSPVSNYINHNVTRSNARLQWSKLSNHQASWLKKTPAELRDVGHAGLIMEVVATRNIVKGEEVFLNYGTPWEEAWQMHVAEWEPPEGSEEYVPASVLNDRLEWLRTEEELEEDPYPSDTVGTYCYTGSQRVRMRFPDPEKIAFMWRYYDGILSDGDNVYPCDILARDPHDDVDDAYNRKDSISPIELRYIVEVHQGEEKGGSIIFHGIPRSAIRFYDYPYTSDIFLRDAFRHEIQLPEDMVPKVWRDMKT